ncbi:DNA helicase HerA-like ATPase [Rudaeicoccus suwonensis]|uniref:DNA helicase HerA-like ATPase n=1 Tax=Rudaeicoccus suwonensis TaxID=657409 RepID=A0A561E4F4_9MICO|nr:DNA helicase HerA-like ATPase [Rudaeicoccus suwonensis]
MTSVVYGRAALWHDPGPPTWFEQTGHTYATLEVVGAPRSADLVAEERQPWQVMRSTGLGVLADAALMPGCSAFEVRYVAQPGAVGTRIRTYLSAMARQPLSPVPGLAVAAAGSQLPHGFETRPPEQPLFDGTSVDVQDLGWAIVELRRREHVTFPEWDDIPAEFYYAVDSSTGDGSGWTKFWSRLMQTTSRVEVSLLFQQTELHPVELNVLGTIMTNLEQLSESHTEYDLYGNAQYLPACANAGIALDKWQNMFRRLKRPLLARFAVRGLPETAVTVATSLATALGERRDETQPHIMTVEAPRTPGTTQQAAFSFDTLELAPWGGDSIWQHERAPFSLMRMPYLYDISDAASLLVLPVPDESGVPGISLSRAITLRRHHDVDDMSDGLYLGYTLSHGERGREERIPLDAINRHTLVVGASGAGKTTTVLSLAHQLWTDHAIPFLAIETRKTEYRSLLMMDGMEQLVVVTLGNDSVSPLRLNILEPPPGVRCESYQGTVLSALKMALPLFAPQPQILTKALALVYENAGWDDDTTIEDNVEPPTIRDLLRAYDTVFNSVGYLGEAKNIGLAFKVRLESLLQGSKGRLLDTTRSSDFLELLSKPLVVELDDIADRDEKMIVSSFLLERVKAEATRRGPSQLRHVTILEEAHRLLTEDSGRQSESEGTGRADAVRAFCEAIAELRANGEGFILSSQHPNQLATAAVANTNTRLIHSMLSDDDREAMLKDLRADEPTRHIAARLAAGELLARWPGRDETELIKILPAEGINTRQGVTTAEVREHMGEHRNRTYQIRPYGLCASSVCPSGCEPEVRRRGRTIANQLEDPLRAASKLPKEKGFVSSALLIAGTAGSEVQTTYCAAVHASIDGYAFAIRQANDKTRQNLEHIVRKVTTPNG